MYKEMHPASGDYMTLKYVKGIGKESERRGGMWL
jgi:hypothetical protein